jgi:hypothetical protein
MLNLTYGYGHYTKDIKLKITKLLLSYGPDINFENIYGLDIFSRFYIYMNKIPHESYDEFIVFPTLRTLFSQGAYPKNKDYFSEAFWSRLTIQDIRGEYDFQIAYKLLMDNTNLPEEIIRSLRPYFVENRKILNNSIKITFT